MPRLDGVEVLRQIKADEDCEVPRRHADHDRRSARGRAVLPAEL
jgi:hypothetical protein